MAKTKLALYDEDQISFFKADQKTVSALAYIKNANGSLVLQAESSSKINFKSSILLDSTLSIGSTNGTVNIGNSGDTISLNVSGVTYNVGTLTGSPVFTGNITAQNAAGTNYLYGTTNFYGTVNYFGGTLNIEATTLTIDDKNIELGAIASPTDNLANGGGITLRGTTDKTIIWDDPNDNWTSSEHWNIASTKLYKINNVNLLGYTDPYTISYQNLKITNTSLTNTTRFVVEGVNGQLFAVVDDLTDSLLSVNDISGLPILEVFATDKVVMGKFGLNTLVVNSDKVGIGIATPSVSLEVNGTIAATLFSGKPGVQSDVRIRGNSAAGDVVLNNGDGRHVFIYNGASTVTAAFTSDGKVGIGTSAPGEKLTIIATANVTTDILKIRDNSLTEKFVVSLDSAGIPYISFNSYGYLRTTANANQLFLASSGNIGIGTATTGTDKLRVEGNGPVIRINATTSSSNLAQLKLSWTGSDTHGLAIGYSAVSAESFIDATYPKVTGTIYGDIRFRRNVASVMTDTLIIKGDTGNVGIGTTAPPQKLTVFGTGLSATFTDNTASNLGISLGFDSTGSTNAYLYSKYVGSGGKLNLGFGETLGASNVMTLVYGGNVGIGTTIPTGKFSIGAQYQFTISDTSNPAGDAYIGHNSYYFSGYQGGSLLYKWQTTHGTYGSRSIGFSYVDPGGIVFYADSAASTAGTSFTPTERMRITNAGNVGIGITSPEDRLSFNTPIYHNASAPTSGISFKAYDASVAKARIQPFFGGTGGAVQLALGSNAYLNTSGLVDRYDDAIASALIRITQFGMFFHLGDNTADAPERFRITTDGKVGIGTTSPESLLHVESATAGHGLARFGTNGNAQIIIEDLDQADATGPYKYFQSNAGKLYFGSATRSGGLPSAYTDQVTIDNSGSVGIGTTSPGYKLDVTGDANISGHLYASVKHFRAADPTNPNHYITYSSLEGPENAVFYRGKVNIKDNIYIIKLPKEWGWLVDSDSLSVYLSSEDDDQHLSYSIYNDTIKIKNNKMLSKHIKCSYLIMATRKDIKPLEVYS